MSDQVIFNIVEWIGAIGLISLLVVQTEWGPK